MRRWAPALAAVAVIGGAILTASALAPVAMNPGDTLSVHCPTTMSGAITAQDANLACAATPAATPTATPIPTPGGIVTLNPVADAYTYASQPSVNFGTNVALRVDASPVTDSFLRFDTTGLSVVSETLLIWAETGQSTGFAVHSVAGLWTEAGLTFSNQPALGAVLGTSGPATTGAWLSINVTGSSFGLDTPNSTALRLSSREGGHPPQLVVSTGVATPSPVPTATPVPTDTPTPAPTPVAGAILHVVIVWLENHEVGSVTAASMPYLFGLGQQYGTASQFFAVSHPSEPNYVAFWSGSTQGITDDGVYNLGAASISNQMDTAGLSWRSYIQAYPATGCATGATYPSRVDGPGTTASNARKHNPAMSFTYVTGNATRCANVQPLSSFDPSVNLAFVAPNLCNDAHDCSLTVADNFLSAWLATVFAAPDWAHTLLVVSFDEGTTNTNGGGHIYTMVARPGLSGFVSATTHNHYGLLRTIEDIFGLPCLASSCSAVSLTEFLP